jgi:hypothetical protein
MPSVKSQAKYRAVDWRTFQLGGYGRPTRLSQSPLVKDGVTKLDADVRAGLRSKPKFSMNTFKSMVTMDGNVEIAKPAKRYTKTEWDALVAERNPVPESTEDWLHKHKIGVYAHA